jgi:hypothetical protein
VDIFFKDLSPLEERLVALRLSFMQIRLMGTERQSTLRGNVVNMENDLDICAQVLPGKFDETSTVQVQLMRRMRYQTPYMYETIKPLKVYKAAKYLMSSELYKYNKMSLFWKTGNCTIKVMERLYQPKSHPILERKKLSCFEIKTQHFVESGLLQVKEKFLFHFIET